MLYVMLGQLLFSSLPPPRNNCGVVNSLEHGDYACSLALMLRTIGTIFLARGVLSQGIHRMSFVHFKMWLVVGVYVCYVSAR